MPIYRTVSDRGLWKKYQRSEQSGQPQHFHKPQYLDKNKPVVTYSQLNLGENIRSYNNRQSNPNIRGDIIAIGSSAVETSSKRDWQRRNSESHVPRKSWASAKSAPATPRATSPSRSRRSTYNTGIGPNNYPYQGTTMSSTMYQQYNQDRGEDDLPPPPPSSTGYTYSGISSRPTTAASQYSYAGNVGNYLRDIAGGQTYLRSHYDEQIPDDRTSFESRSLAAYSQMSSTGRGRESSVVGDYNYTGTSGPAYNYQVEDKDFRRSGYNARNVTTMDIGSTPNSKPNPFVQGSQLQQEAENVVQAFLMNEAGKKSMQQEFVTDQLDSGIMRSPNPGKIEDLPSPTGPYGEMQFQQEDDMSSQTEDNSNFGHQVYNPVPSRSTRTVIANLRKEFLDSATNTSPTKVNGSDTKKTNKYLKNEHRWQPPIKPTLLNGDYEQKDVINVPLNIDTVQKFKAPEIHHAEPVTLRQDETSSSDSDSIKEGIPVGDGSDSQTASVFPSNVILQSPMAPMPSTVTNPSNAYIDQEVPQFHDHNIGLPDPSLPPPPPPEELIHEDPDNMWRNYDDQAFTNYKAMSPKEGNEFGEDVEFYEEQYVTESKKKGNNFFSSLFKRSSTGKGGQKRSSKGKGGKRRPKSDYIPSSTTENYQDNAPYDDQIFLPVDQTAANFEKSKSHQDFSATMSQESQPVYANQTVFKSHSQSGGIVRSDHEAQMMEDEINERRTEQERNQPRPVLERKRSMSKPTDLDELLKLQEQETLEQLQQDAKKFEQKNQVLQDVKVVTQDNVSDVFRNDPWFQNRPTTKTPSPSIPLREPARQVPIHNDGHLGNQPIYENYTTLNIQSLLKPLENPLPKTYPSHETTQEIDIDAILGYTGDDDSKEFNQDEQASTGNYGIATEIDQIEWPQGSNENISPNVENQERIEIEYDPMANFQGTKRKKRSGNIFSFGKGNKKKQHNDNKVRKEQQNTHIAPTEQLPSEPIDEKDALRMEDNCDNLQNGIHEDLNIEETKYTSSPSSRDSSPDKQTKMHNVVKKKQPGNSGLGSFFKSSKKKTSTFVEINQIAWKGKTVEEKSTVTSTSTNYTNEPQHNVDEVHDNRPSRASSIASAKDLKQSSHLDTSGNSQKSPNVRQKPKGGLKGFFRAPGTKSNKTNSEKRFGNTEPVDVSHLVEDDIDSDFGEPPLATSQQIQKVYGEETGNEIKTYVPEDDVFQPIPVLEKIEKDTHIEQQVNTITNTEDLGESDIETIYPKSLATELDSSELHGHKKVNISDGCSESSCSSYAANETKRREKSVNDIGDVKPVPIAESGAVVQLNDLEDSNKRTLEQEEDVIASEPSFEIKEPVEMPAPPEMNIATDHSRGRGREKQKRGGPGFMGLFSTKPPSKPPSRGRREPPLQQVNGGTRSKSLPRRRDSAGKGFSSLFGNAALPSKRRQPSVERLHSSTTSLPRQASEDQNILSSKTEIQQNENANDEQNSYQDKSRRSSTSSQKQMKRQNSGLSGLFSTNPKLPSKRPSPAGTPASSVIQPSSNTPQQKSTQGQRKNNKGFSGLFGSSPTGNSGRKQNPGMRKSTSFPISRPQEAPPQPPNAKMPDVRNANSVQLENTQHPVISKILPTNPEDQVVVAEPNDLMANLYSTSSNEFPNEGQQIFEDNSNQAISHLGENNPRNSPEKEKNNIEDTEKIDVLEADEKTAEVYPTSSNHPVPISNQVSLSQIGNSKPPKQTGRQTGRRSGGFRKPTPDNTQTSFANTTNSSQNSNFHPSNPLQDTTRSKTPTEQSVMRDIFAESVQKSNSRPASAAASRHNSMNSLHQVEGPMANNFQRGIQKDAKGDVGARNSFRQPRKSTSSLGRTESYRQARGDFQTSKTDMEEIDQDEYEMATKNLGTRAGKDRNRKYNSLPRLGSKKRDDRAQNAPNQKRNYNNDIENIGNGPNRAAYNSRPNSRNGPSKPDDACNVM